MKVGDKVRMVGNLYSKMRDGGLPDGYITEIVGVVDYDGDYENDYSVKPHPDYVGPYNQNGRPVFTRNIELVEPVAVSATSNEPKKLDSGKPMMHLVRPEFIEGLAEALTYGSLKYDEERGSEPNYMRGKGFAYSKIYDSLQRHLNAFHKGESVDPESGKHHLLHAGVNIMFLYMYEISDKGVDDRYILPAKKEK